LLVVVVGASGSRREVYFLFDAFRSPLFYWSRFLEPGANEEVKSFG